MLSQGREVPDDHDDRRACEQPQSSCRLDKLSKNIYLRFLSQHPFPSPNSQSKNGPLRTCQCRKPKDLIAHFHNQQQNPQARSCKAPHTVPNVALNLLHPNLAIPKSWARTRSKTGSKPAASSARTPQLRLSPRPLPSLFPLLHTRAADQYLEQTSFPLSFAFFLPRCLEFES